LRARAIERCSRAIEPFWQTTRVSPTVLAFSAEVSERAFGTAPPAHGVTEQSAAGFGQ
jgi:hypothetical protein